MVLSYVCRTQGCALNDISVPDLRCQRSDDGRQRICTECRQPMQVSETAPSGRPEEDTDHGEDVEDEFRHELTLGQV